MNSNQILFLPLNLYKGVRDSFFNTYSSSSSSSSLLLESAVSCSPPGQHVVQGEATSSSQAVGASEAGTAVGGDNESR